MKKHLKLMAALSAVGILTAAAPQLGLVNTAATAYARVIGWVEEEGVWRFYEEADYYVTDSWKKYEKDWYYLNEDGEIATDTRIDEYYVDANGKRVVNQWIKVNNDSYWDSADAPEYFWQYYGKSGKLTVSEWEKVDDNWYYFNEQGHMLTGKVEIGDGTYYLGAKNDGSLKTGWIQLANENDDLEELYSWYYFNNDGKMVVDQVDKKINGSYYTFVDGVMQTDWYKLSETTAENTENKSAAGYQYYLESGARAEGWMEIEGISDVSEEGELYWFFFKNGVPYYAANGIQLFTVNSEKYAFNTKGEMQTGLKVVNLEDEAIANFYFGNSDDGVMKTGKQTIYDEDLAENQTWYFWTKGTRKGQGYHGILDNTVYVYGLRKQAESDLRYASVSLDGVNYLVNINGNIQKASSTSKSSVKPELGAGFKDYKDANEQIFVVDVNGVIQ